MKNKQNSRSYITIKQRVVGTITALFLLMQIVVPGFAAAAYIISDDAITKSLTNTFFQKAAPAQSYLYQKADFAVATNLQHQNISTFHKRLVDAKLSLPAPAYVPIAGDITVLVPTYPVGKLVGEEYVQNRMIRQQIYDLLGRHMIDPEAYASEVDQINALYSNAYVYAQKTNKVYGVKLTSTEVDALTADMIWPETRLINGEFVVVPVLHLTAATIAKQSINDHRIEFFGSVNTFGSTTINNTSLMLGRSSMLQVVGNLTLKNGASIKSEGNIAIRVGGSANVLGSVIQADSSLDLRVGGVFSLVAGQVSAKNNIDIYAGQVSLKPQVHLFTDRYGKGTRLGQISSINAAGDIAIRSTNDIQLEASTITSSGGAITLAANGNINILPVATQYQSHYTEGHWQVDHSSLDIIGSKLSAEDTIQLMAGGAINISASEIMSSQGGIELLAKQGIYVLNEFGQTQTQKVDKIGKTTGTSSDFQTWAIRSVLNAGKGVLLYTDEGDITLTGTKITSTEGTQVTASNGKVHLLIAKEQSQHYLNTVRKGFWTIKTVNEEYVEDTAVPNAIVGGFEVEALHGVDVEYTGKEGSTLAEQIAEYEKMPDMAWMATLYNNNQVSGSVDWNEVELAYKHLRESKSSLSPAAMAIIAVCVAVAMGPMGAGLIGPGGGGAIGGAFSSATVGAAMNAGALTLATQAAQSLASGNNLSETLSQMSSSDSLKSLAVSMATAGAMQQYGDLEVFKVAENTGPAISLLKQAGQVVVNSTISAGISVTINGGNSKDYLNAFNSSLALNTVSVIGNKLAAKISTSASLDEAGKYIAHAALGCAAQSVTAKIQDTDIENACLSGAGGAVISQATADALKAHLDQTIQDAKNGNVSFASVNEMSQNLQSGGADINKLIAGLFAYAVGGDVNAAMDAAELTARSNAYRYASILQINQAIDGRVKQIPGATFAERRANFYEEEARLSMQENGISKAVQDSLIQKAKDAGLFESAGKYDSTFTGDGKLYEDLVSRRAQATFDSSFTSNESMDLETLILDRPYGDVAQPVFNFLGATDRVANILTPEEKMAASFVFTAITGGPIKAALAYAAQVGAAKLIPEGFPDLTGMVARAGLAFTLNRSYEYIDGAYKDAIENPLPADDPVALADGYDMNNAVDGLGWWIDNISGIKSPLKRANGKSVVQSNYETNVGNNSASIAGAGRKHTSYTSIDEFYTASKKGKLEIAVNGEYSHALKNGEFAKYNDGKLGEKVMVDVLEGSTGKKFKAVQNASGNGPDGIFIDESTKPHTIYVAEAKSSVNGADAARPPTGDPAARIDKWIQDFKDGKYDNADLGSQETLKTLEALRAGNAPVNGIWLQIEVPPVNSTSTINSLKVIINAW